MGKVFLSNQAPLNARQKFSNGSEGCRRSKLYFLCRILQKHRHLLHVMHGSDQNGTMGDKTCQSPPHSKTGSCAHGGRCKCCRHCGERVRFSIYQTSLSVNVFSDSLHGPQSLLRDWSAVGDMDRTYFGRFWHLWILRLDYAQTRRSSVSYIWDFKHQIQGWCKYSPFFKLCQILYFCSVAGFFVMKIIVPACGLIHVIIPSSHQTLQSLAQGGYRHA
jgi:hypothetical protein